MLGRFAVPIFIKLTLRIRTFDMTYEVRFIIFENQEIQQIFLFHKNIERSQITIIHRRSMSVK